jgi:hypothetical protein
MSEQNRAFLRIFLKIFSLELHLKEAEVGVYPLLAYTARKAILTSAIPPNPGAPPSYTLSLITILFVASHLAIQGCFIKTSFDKNYWH